MVAGVIPIDQLARGRNSVYERRDIVGRRRKNLQPSLYIGGKNTRKAKWRDRIPMVTGI